MLVLLSGMLEQEPQRPIGEWLILDEAHAIKNRESRIYHSISALRVQFDSCLMMKGTPLDNKWNDAYALISLLRGHPITSFFLFQAAFIKSLTSGPDFPEGLHRERYIQMLNACSLRRPHITVQQEYRKRIAQQYAYHPMLVELEFERDALARAMLRNEAMEAFGEGNPAATDQPVKWKKGRELTLSFEPELQLEYNGRLGPIDRRYVIRRAFEAEPSQVMLATRATGGRGLNLQCFNAVVQCGRWHERFRCVPEGTDFFIPSARKI
ncbi:global transactivator [Fusarium pseudoanthophilum]|uniref:Global transactivator n=1 Tax=Fusarium pseudoanthophilum TaxID=48495 RepID=A0A8H5NYJ9_9HYPO|nr:global transactivator [Fusarium pseudoanthophilum]